MRYPSKLIYSLASKVGFLEDAVSERLGGTDWQVWNWPRYKQEAEFYREQREAIFKEYERLQRLWRQETGKPPPAALDQSVCLELTYRGIARMTEQVGNALKLSA